ncbi:polysaccharide lyase family 7 protein [Planctomycetaceae bacterium]|nr:polysaccharide lyase family 7 protein [bacterium]MDC0307641.1 polysaccharide lyase family 7 protein [Planctomycetaceae bacterium]
MTSCVYAQQAVPAQVLDLQAWKLTVPFRNKGDKQALEVAQPKLSKYSHPDAFFVSKSGDAVVFRAHCGGARTRNSDYPRSELREMLPDGSDEIAWSTDDGGRHELEMEVAITQLPKEKSHVVCAQIHDSEDDVIMIRLEQHKLFVERNELERVMLDKRYQLGTKFTLKIVAEEGEIKVFYNSQLKFSWKVSRPGCYFKAGCYTQSNTRKGDLPNAYAEVAITRIKISHTN